VIVTRYHLLLNRGEAALNIHLDKMLVHHSFIGLNGLKWYAKCSDCSSKKHNDNHPHFQCEECNEVRCIPNVTNEPELIGSQFHVKNILISGICSRCFSV